MPDIVFCSLITLLGISEAVLKVWAEATADKKHAAIRLPIAGESEPLLCLGIFIVTFVVDIKSLEKITGSPSGDSLWFHRCRLEAEEHQEETSEECRRVHDQ